MRNGPGLVARGAGSSAVIEVRNAECGPVGRRPTLQGAARSESEPCRDAEQGPRTRSRTRRMEIFRLGGSFAPPLDANASRSTRIVPPGPALSHHRFFLGICGTVKCGVWIADCGMEDGEKRRELHELARIAEVRTEGGGSLTMKSKMGHWSAGWLGLGPKHCVRWRVSREQSGPGGRVL